VGDSSPYSGDIDEYVNDYQEGQNSGSDGFNSSDFSLSYNYGTGLIDESGQIINLTFNGYKIDSGTVQDAITLYRLTSPGDPATQLYVQESEIPYTHEMIEVGADTYKLMLTVDLSGVISSQIMLEIAPTLTANDGNALWNEDGDSIYGETTEDIYLDYITVTDDNSDGNVIAVTGIEKTLPSNTFNFSYAISDTMDKYASVDGILDIVGTVSTSGDYPIELTSFTMASLAELGVTVNIEQYNWTTDSWENVNASWSGSYNNSTGEVTFSNSSTEEGDIYRMINVPYLVRENTARYGYIHRLTPDNEDLSDISYFRVTDSTATLALYQNEGSLTMNRLGDSENQFVSLDFTNAVYVRENEVTTANIQFYINDAPVNFTSVERKDDDGFYFYFPTGTLSFLKSLRVEILPNLVDTNDTAATDDDQFIANTGEIDLILSSTDNVNIYDGAEMSITNYYLGYTNNNSNYIKVDFNTTSSFFSINSSNFKIYIDGVETTYSSSFSGTDDVYTFNGMANLDYGVTVKLVVYTTLKTDASTYYTTTPMTLTRSF